MRVEPSCCLDCPLTVTPSSNSLCLTEKECSTCGTGGLSTSSSGKRRCLFVQEQMDLHQKFAKPPCHIGYEVIGIGHVDTKTEVDRSRDFNFYARIQELRVIYRIFCGCESFNCSDPPIAWLEEWYITEIQARPSEFSSYIFDGVYGKEESYVLSFSCSSPQ